MFQLSRISRSLVKTTRTLVEQAAERLAKVKAVWFITAQRLATKLPVPQEKLTDPKCNSLLLSSMVPSTIGLEANTKATNKQSMNSRESLPQLIKIMTVDSLVMKSGDTSRITETFKMKPPISSLMLVMLTAAVTSISKSGREPLTFSRPNKSLT